MKTPPTNRIASAYRFSDRLVFHSQARTPAWFYIACEPYLTLSLAASVGEIGQAVKRALANFRPEIPQPTNLKQVTADFLLGIGVKTNKKLQETSVCCGINEKDSAIVFEPSHNGGTSGDTRGFQPITNAKIVISAKATDAEIGAALQKSISLCTTVY
jgi:hypothetical protein